MNIKGREFAYAGSRGISTSPYMRKALIYGKKENKLQYVYKIAPYKIKDKMYKSADDEVKVDNQIQLTAIIGYYIIPHDKKAEQKILNGGFHPESGTRHIPYERDGDYFEKEYSQYYHEFKNEFQLTD